MLRRLPLTLTAVVLAGTLTASNAFAKDGRNAAFAYGALGALAVGALMSSAGSAYAEPAPVVVQPQPVYAPPPVYYAPPPVYYAAPPVAYAPPVRYAPPAASYTPVGDDDDDD